MIRHILTLLLGLAILAGVYWMLASWPFRAIALAYLLLVITGALNFVWMAVVIGMMIFGAFRKHPGLVAAPPLFFAIWFGASVANRYKVDAETDPSLANRVVAAELKDIRTVTLVTRATRGCCGQVSLLANGLIDRYVHAYDDEKGHIGPISLTRLVAARDCTTDELRQSELLQRAGRIDECLKTTTIDAIPDGLVIRMQVRPYYPMVGCCTVGTISTRQNGEERAVATWHSGRQIVLSYVPLFGIPNAPDPTLSLWDGFAGGPFQMIWIGGPAFTGEDLAAAAYGIDWAAPPKAADVGTAELIRRAVEISRGPTRAAALDIALKVQGKGVVDDDVLGVVSSFIETASVGSPSYDQIQRFWFKLNPDQQRKFIELVVARMQDPMVGFDYNRAELPFHLGPGRFPGVADLALRIFEDRRDLKTWQYELALRLAKNGQIPFKSAQYVAEQRQRFRSIQDDTSDAFVSRAIAFQRVYFLSSDEQREFFAQQLDRVSDALLEQFLIAAGWHRNSQDEAALTATTRLLRERAAVRIAAVQDEMLRRNLDERFRNRAN
jgi:hypothetical protein